MLCKSITGSSILVAAMLHCDVRSERARAVIAWLYCSTNIRPMKKHLSRLGQKCGYCGYFLPQNFNLLDHSCFQPFIEGVDTLVVDENFVVTVMSTTEEHGNTLPLAASNDKPTSNVDVAAQEMSGDELLITCVAQKPALFDHRIPANERSNLKKNALWQEVSNLMGGVISAVEAKNRWRYLRDCYSKAKKKENEYIPSGSGADELLKRKNPFRFNQQMAFLDDVILGKSPTCSSLTINTSTNNETRDTASNEPAILVPLPLSSGGSNISDSNISDDAIISAKKKKLDRSKDQNFEDSIVAALRDPIKETDAVDGFLIMLGEGLRKLPYRERSMMQIKFMSLVMEKQEELEYL